MRNIIICCDGTGNEISKNISNVLKLYRCLRKTEKTQPRQMVCGAEMLAWQFVKFYRSSVRSRNLAPAAPSPACAAAAAARATSAATHSAATATAAAAATTATPANNNDGQFHVVARGFLIEEMERGETDVGHFLFAKNEALIGRDVVRLREISSRHRVRGCAPRQRETQSGRTECRYGGGLGRARVLRSLLHPWHGRILS